ncbi:hypothetical protein AB0G06_37355 [Nonomuraea dietziae]|uniref:hypothetical protein n=1 Tax=Nonomuraea dietziae TaxID=65515 RepID=UPI0033D75096
MRPTTTMFRPPVTRAVGDRLGISKRADLGVLDTAIGTVPRALALAGVVRAELMARVQETLAHECW